MIHHSMLIAALGAMLFVFGCSSTPSSPGSARDVAPDWIQKTSRTVDNGYVIYVGVSEARDLDRARFAAESQAFQDLANECSFVPKGARVEDRYERQVGQLQQAYAKVAVDFASCEGAQGTTKPEEIRKLANATVTEQLKRYQESLGDQGDEIALNEGDESNDEGANPALRNTAPIQGTPSPWRWRQVIVVSSVPQYVIVRQQVAVVKQDVILAPPGTYSPGSAASRQVTQSLQTPTQALQQYKTTNPSAVSAAPTWTRLRQEKVHQARMQAYRSAQPRGVKQRMGRAPAPRKKKKRYWP